jgi:ABC-type Fe3+/spermidine/putrescine transport system ATPase subunit
MDMISDAKYPGTRIADERASPRRPPALSEPPELISTARTPSAALTVENLTKSYGAVQVVHGVGFDVEPGTTVTLLGPSGCGKTTTLRCIAGLEVPSGGKIIIGNDVVYDGDRRVVVEPERRNIGMVFQSYAIWPHMSVGGNVGFPLTISGLPRKQIKERTAAILELVGLQDFMDRSASQLSGGQQQRVALARALVHEPRVVLFDEPLSNLDANLRERMRTELQLLQSRLRFSSIFVTHDQEEALALSDKVIVINQGRIEQQGTPQGVFQDPRSQFTARFLGCANILPGRIMRRDETRQVDIDVCPGLQLSARWRSEKPPRSEEPAVVAFRADQVIVTTSATHGRNVIVGEIETASFLGTRFDYTIRVGHVQIKAIGPVDRPCLRGQRVVAEIAVEHCHSFEDTATGVA